MTLNGNGNGNGARGRKLVIWSGVVGGIATGLCLGTILFLLYFFSTQAATNQQSLDRAFNSCVRINLLRRQSNNADYRSWKGFNDSAERERLLAKYIPGNQFPVLKEIHQKSYYNLKGLADDYTWIPPTDCKRSIREGLRYKYPVPRQFYLNWKDPFVLPKPSPNR